MSDRNSPSGVPIFFRETLTFAVNIVVPLAGTVDTPTTPYRAVRDGVGLVVTPTLQWSGDNISTVLTAQVLVDGVVAGPICTDTAAIPTDVYTFSRPIFITLATGGVVTIGLRLTSAVGISTIIGVAGVGTSMMDINPIIGTESANDRT